MRKLPIPSQDRETGEWRYRGKWYDEYPSEEIDKDEAAYDEYCDMRFRQMREDND